MSICADRLGAGFPPRPQSTWPKWPTAGEVHVWEADLAAGDWQGREAVLDRSEQQKAMGFRFERDAMRFVRSRVFRRTVLGAYLRIDPGSVSYCEGEFGRPAIAPHLMGDRYLDFSASKSGNRAVLAIASSPGVGVDVEEGQLLPDVERMAGDFFSVSEADSIRRLRTPDAKQDAFYRCWTRKEALVKAIGTGLHSPTDQFVVGTMPEASPFRPAFGPEWNGPVNLWMVDLSGGAAFAALATSTALTSLSFCRWTA